MNNVGRLICTLCTCSVIVHVGTMVPYFGVTGRILSILTQLHIKEKITAKDHIKEKITTKYDFLQS